MGAILELRRGKVGQPANQIQESFKQEPKTQQNLGTHFEKGVHFNCLNLPP